MKQRVIYWGEWLTSSLSLLHVYLVSHDVAPYYKYSGLTIALLWLILAILWNKRSLILLNLVMTALYLKGLML